jgi:hypothetical protein
MLDRVGAEHLGLARLFCGAARTADSQTEAVFPANACVHTARPAPSCRYRPSCPIASTYRPHSACAH